MAATKPMKILWRIDRPAAGVMATRPTTAPMQAPTAEILRAYRGIKEYPGHHGRCRCKSCGGKGLNRLTTGGECRARVKPNQPNHSAAVPRMINGMLAGWWWYFPRSRACRRPQRSKPCRHMYDRSSGKVENAKLPQESIRVPGPVRQRGYK